MMLELENRKSCSVSEYENQLNKRIFYEDIGREDIKLIKSRNGVKSNSSDLPGKQDGVSYVSLNQKNQSGMEDRIGSLKTEVMQENKN